MKIITWIKSEYTTLINSIAFYNAKREANKKHQLTGRRYHVIPTSDNKLMVVDNNFVKHYNKMTKGSKAKKLTIDVLIQMSYYSTSVQGITRSKTAEPKWYKLTRIFSKN